MASKSVRKWCIKAYEQNVYRNIQAEGEGTVRRFEGIK